MVREDFDDLFIGQGPQRGGHKEAFGKVQSGDPISAQEQILLLVLIFYFLEHYEVFQMLGP